MCKGTSNFEDVYIIKKELIPPSTLSKLREGWIDNNGGIPVDKCIGEEVEDLIVKGILTKASCCGHGEYRSHVLVGNKELPKIIELGYEYEPFRWEMHYVYLKSGTQLENLQI